VSFWPWRASAHRFGALWRRFFYAQQTHKGVYSAWIHSFPHLTDTLFCGSIKPETGDCLAVLQAGYTAEQKTEQNPVKWVDLSI
jgi:hypothetical protein